MKKHRILGIYRNPRFSNNAIEADRLILEESIAQLQKRTPLELEMIEEDEALEAFGSYDLVLNMAQAEHTLKCLDKNFGQSPIWNSPGSIRNCYRKAMSRIVSSLNVGYVPFRTLDTSQPAPQLEPGSYWLKRSDFHAISDEDVTLAENSEEVALKLAAFRARGVSEVILQAHVHGDIYKFYGVSGKLFRMIRVREFLPSPPRPDGVALEKYAFAAAEALGLQIFGGDAILDAAGKFHLIDVNDWPSFRICRPDASAAIGSLAADFLEGMPASLRPASASASLQN
ncbi:MAG TPA: hypothetical protein VIH99_07155 [Bdellovibrionota bacterium]